MKLKNCNVYVEKVSGLYYVRIRQCGTERYDGEDGYTLQHNQYQPSRRAAEAFADKVRKSGKFSLRYWDAVDVCGCCVPREIREAYGRGW